MANEQHARVVLVTPAKAAAWLKRQEALEKTDPLMRQRTVKEPNVKKYARDMAAGQWMLNGETILLAPNGRILDGQHRLLACVEADKPFKTYLVENVPHDAMRTIDTGAMRSAGDQLAIYGKHNSAILATALGVIFKWEKTNRRGFDWSARPTRLELFQVLENHAGLEPFAGKVSRLGKLMSEGLAAALWYIFAQQEETLAALFFDTLATGVNMAENDPVFLLRERLLRERQDQLARRIRKAHTMDYTTDLVFRAWDATRRGVNLTKLQRGKTSDGRQLLTRRTSGTKKEQQA